MGRFTARIIKKMLEKNEFSEKKHDPRERERERERKSAQKNDHQSNWSTLCCAMSMSICEWIALGCRFL